MEALMNELQSIGLSPEQKRGKVWVSGMDVSRIIDGIPVSFTRRRYSNCTFTWASAFHAGEWKSLGDPFQCVTPSRSALAQEIARLA